MTELPDSGQVTWLPAPTFLARESLVSKNTFYAEINRFAATEGKAGIPHIRVGRKIFVPENAFELMLAAKAGASTGTVR